jgi:hypothetical protein
MGCGCKKPIADEKDKKVLIKKKITFKNNIIINLILFLLMVVLVPILYPFIIMVLFKHFVIGGNINFLDYINKFKKKEKNIDDIDIEKINPDDYELLGVDKIEVVSNE